MRRVNGVVADKLYDELKAAIQQVGPLVVEFTVCSKCGQEELSFHPFMESHRCEWCGHRNASQVPRYRDPAGDTECSA